MMQCQSLLLILWISVFVASQEVKVSPSLKEPSLVSLALAEFHATVDQVVKEAEHYKEEGVMVTRSMVLGDIAESVANAGFFNKAVQIAMQITNLSMRSMTLCSIAEITTKEGDVEKGLNILDYAIKIASQIQNAYSRSITLCNVAKVMTKIGEKQKGMDIFTQAIQVATQIENFRYRSMALCEIGRAMAEIAENEEIMTIFKQAIQSAQKIQDTKERLWQLGKISEYMVRVGFFDEAVKVTEQIVDTEYRLNILYQILEIMVEAGRKPKILPDQLLKVALQIEDPERRLTSLFTIVKIMIKIGQTESAMRLLDRVVRSAKGIKPKYYNIDGQLHEIIRVLADAKFFDEALVVAKQIEDAEDRSWALCSIAHTMIKFGDMRKGISILEQAIEIAKRAEFVQCLNILGWIAETMAKSGESEKAMAIFDQAIEVGKQFKRERATAIHTFSLRILDIVRAMARVGFFDKALQVLEQIEVLSYRMNALCDIAKSMAKAGLIDKSIQVAEKIEFDDIRSLALYEIVITLVKKGDFKRAFQIAKNVETPIVRFRAFSFLVQEMRRAGLIKDVRG